MAERYAAFGTQLQLGSTNVTATAVFTTIANITNIDPPDATTDMIDVSAHDDASRFRVFVGGRIDPGEVSIDGWLDPANVTHIGAAGLQGLHATGEERAFKMIFPDAGAMEVDFLGIVTGFKPGPAPQDGALGFSATIKVSGATTYTA